MNIIGNKKIGHGVVVRECPYTAGTNDVTGYIEPACDDPQWILWVTEDGDAILYTTQRVPDGLSIGEPIRIRARSGDARPGEDNYIKCSECGRVIRPGDDWMVEPEGGALCYKCGNKYLAGLPAAEQDRLIGKRRRWLKPPQGE